MLLGLLLALLAAGDGNALALGFGLLRLRGGLELLVEAGDEVFSTGHTAGGLGLLYCSLEDVVGTVLRAPQSLWRVGREAAVRFRQA